MGIYQFMVNKAAGAAQAIAEAKAKATEAKAKATEDYERGRADGALEYQKNLREQGYRKSYEDDLA